MSRMSRMSRQCRDIEKSNINSMLQNVPVNNVPTPRDIEKIQLFQQCPMPRFFLPLRGRDLIHPSPWGKGERAREHWRQTTEDYEHGKLRSGHHARTDPPGKCSCVIHRSKRLCYAFSMSGKVITFAVCPRCKGLFVIEKGPLGGWRYQIYCSQRCCRAAQNERRKYLRQWEPEHHPWTSDPWRDAPLPETVTANALLDPPPVPLG